MGNPRSPLPPPLPHSSTTPSTLASPTSLRQVSQPTGRIRPLEAGDLASPSLDLRIRTGSRASVACPTGGAVWRGHTSCPVGSLADRAALLLWPRAMLWLASPCMATAVAAAAGLDTSSARRGRLPLPARVCGRWPGLPLPSAFGQRFPRAGSVTGGRSCWACRRWAWPRAASSCWWPAHHPTRIYVGRSWLDRTGQHRLPQPSLVGLASSRLLSPNCRGTWPRPTSEHSRTRVGLAAACWGPHQLVT